MMTEQTIAQRRINEFRRKCGENTLGLAYHAALPVVINAELLHLLRINFFLDCTPPLDYTAEGDLLLSPLCFEIGDGLYEIEHTIRDELLKGLLKDYGQERVRWIAALLKRYTERHLPWHRRPALKRAQELTALDAIDHAQATLWLGEVQRGTELEPGQQEWFVAMRGDIEHRNITKVEPGQKRTFEFYVITVNKRGEEIKRRRGKAESIAEDLGNSVFLEMVFIPGGTFLMGSPETEKSRQKNEGPQHEVTLELFLMGKYQVTQAQWQAVAALPQVERELKPDLSRFKGARRPVEQVSWDDAVEFCKRLSQHSGRDYRLPSEAEWEYACRAGTTTPFHFGATITTDLANYNGNSTYASAPKGANHWETTEVGSFPPNAFGLYDMHGNVWEWCADPHHDNYEGAPTDGSVWEEDEKTNKRSFRLRGGSWNYHPDNCRCANRRRSNPDGRFDFDGFRVVVSWASRTL